MVTMDLKESWRRLEAVAGAVLKNFKEKLDNKIRIAIGTQ
jgi:hypothetical protein